uniref:Vacuolar protein 14 C-terminal Fig4-binding domain-containing protein n=1 Tax=Globisporangium ultimum (strain ATCC 200006 / CBS 805.95 / DAOM BR144) TaxID=431595 RepID=K3W541_GLOUD
MNPPPNRDATPLLPQSALAQAAAAAIPFLQPAQQQENAYSETTAGGFPVQLPLSPTLLRNLGDRSYDKRKGAAMEVENLIKQLQENAASVEYRQRQFMLHQQQQQAANGSSPSAKPSDEITTMSNPSRERIPAIIELLGNEFAFSTNANHRKGGLIGLAATAIGLMHEAHLYLDKLLPPVLHCFDDPESRVRYYACESLYNIAKVARGHILAYFNKIFDGLCKLFADVDVDVKNGANLLDRLVKDIVTESEYFEVDMFIPLLQKYIRMTNPYIRQLLVGWITVLDSVPDIDMLDYLPDFLDGLFNMLSDGNREIRQAADSALSEFLREIKQTEDVDFGRMVEILVGQCNSKERFNRLTAVTWVHEFVTLGGEKLVEFYAELLAAIMHCISDAEHEIRQVAERANADLLQLVKSTSEEVELVPIMEKLNKELSSDHAPTRKAALRWISMLLDKYPNQLVSHIGTLLPTLLKTLSDSSDKVVLLDLEVLARISLNEVEFEKVLNAVLQLFAHDRRLLEQRGSMIVRKLCELLDSKNIYMIFAKVLGAGASGLETQMDGEFSSVMVQTLNLILLTANELEKLREVLRRSFQKQASKEDIQVFTALFQSWCHNPVAAFSLCLLAQSYTLSSALISKLYPFDALYCIGREIAYIDASVGFLMQIDKLVQLLESPIFIHMRLQLLEIHEDYHADLVKSLYGLLMLLPQSAAFRMLRDRLVSVTNMATAIGRIDIGAARPPQGSNSTTATADKSTSKSRVDTVALLAHFDSVQKKHTEIRKKG